MTAWRATGRNHQVLLRVFAVRSGTDHSPGVASPSSRNGYCSRGQQGSLEPHCKVMQPPPHQLLAKKCSSQPDLRKRGNHFCHHLRLPGDVTEHRLQPHAATLLAGGSADTDDRMSTNCFRNDNAGKISSSLPLKQSMARLETKAHRLLIRTFAGNSSRIIAHAGLWMHVGL